VQELRAALKQMELQRQAARRRAVCLAAADELWKAHPEEDAHQWAVPALVRDATELQEKVLALKLERRAQKLLGPQALLQLAQTERELRALEVSQPAQVQPVQRASVTRA
jgi:hypothetical protein